MNKPSLLCRIFGHKWREFEVTETRLVPETRLVNAGFAQFDEVYTGRLTNQDYGYDKEIKTCRRCGELNPNYKPEKK